LQTPVSNPAHTENGKKALVLGVIIVAVVIIIGGVWLVLKG
jgi:hypothetical protein